MAPTARREQLVDAALRVIVEQGYAGVSIEAIARTAGVTRPVVYDHFPNLGALLESLIEREERIALAQIAEAVPMPEPPPAGDDPIARLGERTRLFLEAVASRPSTWRIILLPLEGTPAIVREHVEANRALIRERIEQLIRAAREDAPERGPRDVELAARTIMALAEEAGRCVLTDPERFSPGRYETFVRSMLAGPDASPPGR